VTVADPASPAAQEFAQIAGKLAELCKI
jgi:hypothetical protein